MADFPHRGSIEAAGEWLSKKGFPKDCFAAYDSDALIGLTDLSVIEKFLPAGDAVRLWALLNTARGSSSSSSHVLSSPDTSGHVSVTGTITPTIAHALQVLPLHPSTSITAHGSEYYLELWARVLKRKRTGYILAIDSHARKVSLKKRGHMAIVWFDMSNSAFVRDMYICFRLCGDKVGAFVVHCQSVTHEQLNGYVTGTPPEVIDYAPVFHQ